MWRLIIRIGLRMEAENSHERPSGSWTSGKASGVIQHEPEGLRTRELMI